MFEKVVRQVTNRIDEMEDTIKRCGNSGGGSGGMLGNPITPGGPRGPGGGGGGGGSGGSSANQLVPIFQQQNTQLSTVKKDLDEIKGLMQRLLKTPLQQKQGSSSQPPPSHQEPPKQPPPQQYPPQPQYPIQPVQPQYPPQPTQTLPPSNVLYPTIPRGYTSDTDHTPGFGRGRGRGRKKKRGKASGYESDGYSVASEAVPMQKYQRGPPRSPGSVQSAPGGKNKRRKGQKPLTGSWEDIRTDLHV